MLPGEFAERFRNVAGFRNVLVNGYLDVDLDLVGQVLSRHLNDFEIFSQHVEGWLAQAGSDPEPSPPAPS